MNKTITINIAGLSFHIDEDAFQRLDSYINAVKNSIQQEESKDEIIADIEGRIAELFAERIDMQSGVIRTKEVDEIIHIMGKPEDYIIDEETSQTQQSTFKGGRKIYRDGEKRVLGGVCAGLGHYLNVDALWIRIAFLVLFFAYGVSILVYFILWIIIPKARSVADILEMKGEPVNISSIEQQFRQGLTNSYQAIKSNGKTAGDIIRKILGIALIVFGAFGVFGSFFIPLAVNEAELFDMTGFSVSMAKEIMVQSMVFPFWLVLLALFFMSCLPFVVIILAGVKILKPNTKHVGVTSVVLGVLWLLALFVFSYVMINSGKAYSQFRKNIRENYEVRVSKTDLLLKDNDTLHLLFERDPRIFTVNDTAEVRYSELDHVRVEILESTSGNAYVEIEEEILVNDSDIAEKYKTYLSKSQNNNTLDYNFSNKIDTLTLSNSILTTLNDFTEENKVKVKVYITPTQTIRINERDEDYLRYLDLESGNNYYQFQKGRLDITPRDSMYYDL